jgi:hypothetical protein
VNPVAGVGGYLAGSDEVVLEAWGVSGGHQARVPWSSIRR